MKTLKIGAIIITLALVAISCEQAPVFYIISTETAPIPPLIEGAPTNMVVANWEEEDPDDPNLTKKIPILYVASGKLLYWYAKSALTNEPGWNSEEYEIPHPREGERITSLAVAKNSAGKDRLYALCRSDSNGRATLVYIDHFSDTEWAPVYYGSGDIQSIYADPDGSRLFAGAGTGDSKTYTILYLHDDGLEPLLNNTSLLSGAICRDNSYYLSTTGDGIFKVDIDGSGVPSAERLLIEDDSIADDRKEEQSKRIFMSMIKLEDETIITVERQSGVLYTVDSTNLTKMKYTGGGEWNDQVIETGKYATGAITLWEGDNKKRLLIGIQYNLSTTSLSYYTHGYVEFVLKEEDGSFDSTSFRHDSGNLESLWPNGNQDRYKTSLGTRPINHLFQAPYSIDTAMTFFASTQTAGLWSYRDRPNGGWQWNAEQ